MSLKCKIERSFETFHLAIDFEQPEKGVTALFGPSGAGKSLTINMIAGLVTPTSGKIELNGNTLFCSEKRINQATHKRNIGYVFQDSRLFPHKTIQNNLLFGTQRAKTKPTKSTIEHLIELLDIEHLLQRYPSNLSGGEKQRVAIGRALLSQPDLLLLDEPLSALDHRRQEEVIKHLAAIKAEADIPILLITHSMDEVTRLADHVVLLEQGRIAAQGTIHDITSRLDLLPLTGRLEASTILNGTIAAHDPDQAMTSIQIESNLIFVPQMDEEVGAAVRVRIKSRDVMLSKLEPTGISANNILPVTLLDHSAPDGMHVDVKLSIGKQILLSQITSKSWQRLQLVKGDSLFVVIKSVILSK